MSKNYPTERVGQLEFFETFKIADAQLANYTDGVYFGTIFEFKKSISNVNSTLLQAIKYLSHMRVRGESIPANIMLISLNQETAYLFKSDDYQEDIEKPYGGAASKDNEDFSAHTDPEIINYNSASGFNRIEQILADKSYTKIHIDVFCVVGWAERFYREIPKATKIMLFEELREPKFFKEFIYPWVGEETDFKYIMDLLNDKEHKKELGAFYTPPAYCRKATELVRKAISKIPKGNNYIILDRCAGSGNLEEFLTDKPVAEITIGELSRFLPAEVIRSYLEDKKNVIAMLGSGDFNGITMEELESYPTNISINDYLFDNEISRVIVNTYELKEWLVLYERFGDKVNLIIPPPKEVNNTEGLVSGGDALSAQFVKAQGSLHMTADYTDSINKLLDYINDPKTNIILFENPPYSDVGAVKNNPATATKKTSWKSSFVSIEMKKWMTRNRDVNSRATNDLANLFIWSGFEYYLRKPDDSYILFSPPKYIKSHHLVSKELAEGYIFNRAFFHASPSAISCIWWRNRHQEKKEYELEILDIVEGELLSLGNLVVKKVYKNLSHFYERQSTHKHSNDVPGIILEWNGVETKRDHPRLKPIYNENIVGYLVAQDFGFEHPRLSTNLVRTLVYAEHGFYLRKDNYLEKLPLFAAGKYEFGKRWWENGTVFKCADGGDAYTKDQDFLKSCLFFTALSYYNKCRSFEGSDGRYYKNELCFDGDTIAMCKLKDFKLTVEENELLELFRKVLKEARSTPNFNSQFSYGTYQIDQELNTQHQNEEGELEYDHPLLNGALKSLRIKVGQYYETNIRPKLFQYELLK